MLTPEKLDVHVKTNVRKMYSGEMNEIFLNLYATMQLALRLGTSKLVIGPTQVIHLDKNGQVIFKLHSDQSATELAKSEILKSNYMEVFSLILSRDELVSSHIELLISTPKQAEYIIKNG